jgi:hypothetical protein
VPPTIHHPRRNRRGESRWPPVVATAVALALYSLLPAPLLYGTRYVVPVLEVLLVVPLVAFNPGRLTRESGWSRVVSLVLVMIIVLANLVAFVLLVRALLGYRSLPGRELLLAALQIWLTNVIAFGLIYWELDRGGPVARTQLARDQLPPADFLFPQDTGQQAVTEVAAHSSRSSDWVPSLVDYMYVSVTNSTAFSPTDTMPLTPRAKLLMGLQGIAAMGISLLIVARAVNILR